MTEKELKLSVKDPAGGYFFYGDEDYLKEYYISVIKRAVVSDESLAVFNFVLLDDDSFSVSALEDAISSPPMMADKKLVCVRITSYSSLPEKEKKALAELLSSLSTFSDTVLVISVAPDGFDAGTEKRPSAALKALSSLVNCVNFPLGQEAKLIRWLIRHFENGGVGADEGALRLMISLCGRSMHRLAGEAEKVTYRTLAMGQSVVTRDIVATTVTATPEEDAFLLANSVLAGNTDTALVCLGRAKRRNENPIKLLASVSAVLYDMAAVASLAFEGYEKREIATSLKMHEYKVGLYLKACGNIPLEVLSETVEMCAQADLKMKSLSLGYVPLERLICAVGDMGEDKD